MTSENKNIAAFDTSEEPEWTPPPWPEWLPEPGIYHNVPFEIYKEWPACNASALKIAASVTAKHMKAYMSGLMDTDSPSRRFGRAQHCYMLEGLEAFESRVSVATPCAAPIQKGARAGQPCGCDGKFRLDGLWYCGKHAKQGEDVGDYISANDWENIKAAAHEIAKHKTVHLFRAHGGTEVSLIWERDGLPCKGRVDKLIPGATMETGETVPAIMDLKKILPCKGTEYELQKAIREYGYDLSASWYCDGYERLQGERPLFIWVFAESGYPYDVAARQASAATMEVGRSKAQTVWDLYRQNVQHDTWQGYGDDLETIDPAEWEQKRYGLTR